MRYLALLLSLLVVTGINAEDIIIRKTDAFGNVQKHENGIVIQDDGRIIQIDPYGDKLYHKDQYTVTKGKTIVKTTPNGTTLRPVAKPVK